MVRLLRLLFQGEGYHVIEAQSGWEAVDWVREVQPDLVTLDILMPGMDGFETLRLMRQVSGVPVIMVSVLDEEGDKVQGLELGADDYITKPFHVRELVGRVRAVLRRTSAVPRHKPPVLRVDDRLSVDFAERQVIVEGTPVKLRPTEYRLLHQLVSHAGAVVPSKVLLAKVWGDDHENEIANLRLYILYLRRKIEKDSIHPRYILSEPGVGYRFVADALLT
jgi:two-component system KDP operon response regulator KdpE